MMLRKTAQGLNRRLRFAPSIYALNAEHARQNHLAGESDLTSLMQTLRATELDGDALSQSCRVLPNCLAPTKCASCLTSQRDRFI